MKYKNLIAKVEKRIGNPYNPVEYADLLKWEHHYRIYHKTLQSWRRMWVTRAENVPVLTVENLRNMRGVYIWRMGGYVYRVEKHTPKYIYIKPMGISPEGLYEIANPAERIHVNRIGYEPYLFRPLAGYDREGNFIDVLHMSNRVAKFADLITALERQSRYLD